MYKKPKLELQTTTLWDYPSQHYGEGMQGDRGYKGATPSYVIWNLLQRYTRPGERVLDPMCGSGTTLDVCRDLGRAGVGFDLQPTRPEIAFADARRLPLPEAAVDFVFVDPPYSTHLKYSGLPECIGELDADGGGYYEAMEEVIEEIDRVLRPGRYMALYVSDSWRQDHPFAPIGFELFSRLSRRFTPVDIVAVTRRNKTMKHGHWHRSATEGNYFLRGFNYLFIMKKEDGPGARTSPPPRRRAPLPAPPPPKPFPRGKQPRKKKRSRL
jgi:DNA modification methylase